MKAQNDSIRFYAIYLAIFTVLLGCSESKPESQPTTPSKSAAPQASGQSGQAPMGLIAQIELADSLEPLSDSAMMYVFIRQPGERMPIAVQHFPAKELPKTVKFDGNQVFSEVELVARLSPSGQVEKSAADTETIARAPFGHPPHSISLFVGGAAKISTAQATSIASKPMELMVKIDINSSVTVKNQQAAVFVIAKAAHTVIPAAVRKFSLNDLPTQVRLTDDHSMMVTNKLSMAEKLTVTVRISESGDASAKAGDWFGDSEQILVEHAEFDSEGAAKTIEVPVQVNQQVKGS